VWWLGGIYSPNHQKNRWWRLLSYGAPDSPVRQPHHQVVGFRPLELLTTGPPDSHCSLSGAPFDACSDFCARSEHCSLFLYRCRRPLALGAVAPLGAPDSPVNYSGAASRIPKGGKFRVELPGAPDTVRWHTGQYGAPDQGCLWVVFCSLCLDPFLVFLLVCCEPLAPIKLII
jgi:hypothetical protein